MSAIILLLVCTFLAGLAMPAGALTAHHGFWRNSWFENEFRHGVIAFGGGALLSAVALVLVPEGVPHFNPASAPLLILAGAVAFMLTDIFLARRKTSASQLLAMLMDFIPESIALGATFASGNATAFLLAGLIGLQNLPEGFNAYHELKENSDYRAFTIIGAFFLMSLLGPAAGLIGYLWLQDAQMTVGGIMLFAAGGILYSLFQDIAPQAKLENHWAPPLGAILGFILGTVGFMLAQ